MFIWTNKLPIAVHRHYFIYSIFRHCDSDPFTYISLIVIFIPLHHHYKAVVAGCTERIPFVSATPFIAPFLF